jgi:hypothetical protein
MPDYADVDCASTLLLQLETNHLKGKCEHFGYGTEWVGVKLALATEKRQLNMHGCPIPLPWRKVWLQAAATSGVTLYAVRAASALPSTDTRWMPYLTNSSLSESLNTLAWYFVLATRRMLLATNILQPDVRYPAPLKLKPADWRDSKLIQITSLTLMTYRVFLKRCSVLVAYNRVL